MKLRRATVLPVLVITIIMGAAPVFAHVPFIERQDYSEHSPFVIRDVEQSKAIYSWLETPDDVDLYIFEVTSPVQLFAEAIVPVCPSYEQFLPWFAVIGPGLPRPNVEFPIRLPDGHGAIVVPNVPPGEPRDVFFEPFGGKWYYDGPDFDQGISAPGIWALIYWDPYRMGGDYVAAIGKDERFDGKDVIRSLINTAIIRQDGELHVEC